MFSKFLHAAALLFPRQVRGLHRQAMHALVSAGNPLVQEPACACHEETISIVVLHMGICKSQVHSVGVPYWFLPDEGGTMTPATYEEMADTSDVYLKVSVIA